MDLFFRPEPVIWVQDTLGPGWEGVLGWIALLGVVWGILLAAGVGFWLFGRGVLYAVLALAAVEGVVRKAVSLTTSVERPSDPRVIKYETVEGSASFPSGHLSTAAALWLYLGVATRFPLGLAWVMVLGVAVGRIYLGVHYAVDVVAGLALGALMAWGWAKAWPHMHRALASRPPGFWLGVAGAALAGSVAAAAWYVGDIPRQWKWVAFVSAAALALPAEWRWVRYRPPEGRAARAGVLALGLAGVLPLLVVDRLAGGEEALGLSAVTVALATLWAFLGAPALGRRLGGMETGGEVGAGE